MKVQIKDKMNKALLVIDMQKGSFTEVTPRYDTEGVVSRINGLSSLFRKMDFPVIFIQHDGTGSGEFEKHKWGWELLDALETKPTDILIDKYANDVFYNSKLQSSLEERNVDELIITGCATDFCVESTIQSGLTKDFDITVISDGHTTGERPNLTSKQVIAHYNWVWQNMIPTKGKIDVMSFNEMKEMLKL
ncbi:isochorismatase family protein [Maribacter dokdonensis]|uniref:isochorismatase family protein n=1 Tax=Maribacter dokdonensis TaxID=320912 RepID=UPI001B32E7AB|nr:isochorismatase family protein [Maribacter dokdonensis]